MSPVGALFSAQGESVMRIALGLMLALTPGFAQPQLEAFAPYVGHCWAADIAADTVDRHCFEAVYGGQHIRDAHSVTKDGNSVYAGETLYSVEAGRIVFTYWNSLGGVGRGSATADGPDLQFALSMRATPDAAPLAVAPLWHRTADGYDVTTDGEKRHFRLDDGRPRAF